MDRTSTLDQSSRESSVRTSREVIVKKQQPTRPADAKQDDEESSVSISSPTSTLGEDSRSSADIPSELLEPDSTSASRDKHQDREAANDLNERLLGRQGNNTSSATVHGHVLPTGWACKYDPGTDEYKFEYKLEDDIEGPILGGEESIRRTSTRDDTVQTSRRPTLELFECKYGYHFPTSPTSSMISELAKQVQKTSATPSAKQATAAKTRQITYGKHKLTIPSDEEEQTKRLQDMFPTAPGPIIEQMIRIYHGREGLIKAALISLGYKRSTEYNVQQATAQSPIMLMLSKPASKKLFEKLVGYFPGKDEFIKSLMYKHKEVEHEIISALVESNQENMSMRCSARKQLDPKSGLDKSGAIMKLRYLKFLYPTCGETELYHLLNCNDLNAQRVMELVEEKGHKRINIEDAIQNRKLQTQQMRAQQVAHAAKDPVASSASELVQAHVTRTKPNVADSRVKNLTENIKKSLEGMDEDLIGRALVAADYNETLAKKFLLEMQPFDENSLRQRYEIRCEMKPDVIAFPCKAIQKGSTNFMTIVANDYVYIPREIIECDNALALLKVDAATFTQEDFPKARFTHRVGPRLGLAEGSKYGKKESEVARESLRKGPREAIRLGSKYQEVCSEARRSKPNSLAKGHSVLLAQGRNLALNCGHRFKLIQREHPFFKPDVKSS